MAALGPTGQYPRGKIRPDDEGELAMAITVDARTSTVILNFSTPVTWMGMSADSALQLASILTKAVKEIQPLTEGIEELEKA